MLNLKKFVVVLLLFVAACSVAQAGVAVGWYFGWGMYTQGCHNVTSGTGGGVAQYTNVLWQLIWAGPDGIANWVDLDDPNYVGGDDVFWDSHVTLSGGSGTADQWLYTGGVAPHTYSNSVDYGESSLNLPGASNMFIRVFQDNTPALGEWFYNSPIALVQNYDWTAFPPAAPQQFDGNTNSGFEGDTLNRVIPEPASLALLGLGFGFAAIRRRMKK